MILSLHSHLQNQTFLICVTFNLLVCTLGEGLLATVFRTKLYWEHNGQTIISTCETIISKGSNVRVTIYFTSLFFPSVYVKATDKYFSQRKLRATSVNAPAKDVN